MSKDESNPYPSDNFLHRIGLNFDDMPNLLDDEPLISPDQDLAEILRQRCASLLSLHTFAVGDLVTWKPGMSNRRLPLQGRPAIVVEVLPEPVFDSKWKAGWTHFREPLDIVLAVILEYGPHRGDFLYWHFDSRRFQPWQPKEQ